MCVPAVYWSGTDGIPQYTTVSVHRGIRLKTVGFTCTRITHTRGRYGVTGDRYSVIQSHPWCDLCYTLRILIFVIGWYMILALIWSWTSVDHILHLTYHDELMIEWDTPVPRWYNSTVQCDGASGTRECCQILRWTVWTDMTISHSL